MAIHALVIDDDNLNLEVLGRLLASEGATYTAVQDPTHLKATLENLKHLDIVFLDLEMPKMDGYAAFELLQSKLGTEIPIIACTVHTNEIENARHLGFAGFLGKPLDPARFKHQFARIRRNLPVWEAG